MGNFIVRNLTSNITQYAFSCFKIYYRQKALEKKLSIYDLLFLDLRAHCGQNRKKERNKKQTYGQMGLTGLYFSSTSQFNIIRLKNWNVQGFLKNNQKITM